MTKHGVSHAGATLVCAVASGLLVGQVDKHVPAVNNALASVFHWLKSTFNLGLSPAALTQWQLMGVLAFIWGIAYKLTINRD